MVWTILNRFGFLSHMPEASKATLLAAGHVISLAPGQCAQHQGEVPNGLCCLLRGQMRFSSVDEAGREFVLYIGYPGTWFGQAMLDDEPAIVSATAMVASDVFFVPAGRVVNLLSTDPHMGLFVIRSLIWIGRSVIRRLRERITLPNAAVVACLFCQQLLEGPAGRDAVRPTLHLSQTEIATVCGLSVKTVNRVVLDLKRRRIIDVSYNSVTILDCKALERIAADTVDAG
jgi:CRP-like cAMP-binding protein